jgi:hypothetical protein
MDRPPLSLGELVRKISRARGTNGKLGCVHDGALPF